MSDGQSWTPRKEVFVRRAAVAAAITFGLLVAVGLVVFYLIELPIFWVFPSALFLTIGFLVDDAMRWRAAKYDRWEIEEGHLLHKGLEGPARVPLSEIKRVFTRIGGRVVVEFNSGQRIVMGYLPFPGKTAKAIDAARPR